MTKPRSSFFVLSPRNTFKIICIMAIIILIPKPWKTSRIFSVAIMMLIHLRKPINNKIIVTIKANPLVAIVLLSPLVTMKIQHLHPPCHQTVVITTVTTVLTIDLALDRSVTPACHKFMINVVFVKTPAQLNGLIAKCITPSLVPRQPKISMRYTNLQNLQNLNHCPLIIPTCRHATTIPLNPTITLTTIATLQNAAALVFVRAVLTTTNHNDDWCSCQSSCAQVDSIYAVHNTICLSRKTYLDVMGYDPVSPPKDLSEVSSHSDGPDHSAWHTYQDETFTILFILMVVEIVKTTLPLHTHQLI